MNGAIFPRMTTEGLSLPIAVAIAGYLLGGFPTGVVISRARYRIDVREMGSGNIGATNVTRSFGWFAGVVTLAIDFFKGFLPLAWLASAYPSDPWLWVTAGLALVAGHCFSPYLRFRGGKGVATSLGCVAAVLPWLAAACALGYAIALLATRISAIGSLTGVLVTLAYCLAWRVRPPVLCLLLGMSALVLVRHSGNIRRLYTEWRASRVGRNPT